MANIIKVLNIIADNSNNGVGYYRQYNPMEIAAKHGACDVYQHGYNHGQKHVPAMSLEDMVKYGKWADIIFASRNDVPIYISTMAALSHECGIPLVYDYDDNVQLVRPYNPGYRSFLPNADTKKWNIKAAEMCTALTVTTQNLKDYYQKHNKNIFICPNSIDFGWRDKYLNVEPYVPKKEGEIRIGWAGSAAHWENLNVINKVITRIMKEFKNVTFYFTGLFGGLFDDKEIKDRVFTVKFADMQDWPAHLKKMGLDIAVAPLADNLFNRAKSNLRCIEYQACKYPIIASDVEPYRYLKNGETGFIAKEEEDWYNHLKNLILDKDLRNELGENGYKQAKDEFNMDKNYKFWIDAFTQIIDNFKNEK